MHAAVKGPEGVLEWTPECRKSFDEIRRKLMEASALGLPNLRKPFQLYGAGKDRWDTVFVPHAVSSLLENKGHHWISPSRLAKYQAVLLEQDDVVISLTSALNPATLLPISESGELHHDCLTTIEQVYSSRPDLRDEPLPNAELELFTDGSSFMLEGRRKAGYAVVTRTQALEAKSLPSNTSAQKAELVALTRALELSQGKRVNIYTDSKYAFGVVHAHGAIWKERGLLSSHGTPIKYGTEIMKLLQAVLQLKEVAIMHCKAHQKGNSEITKGNRKADQLAKEAALQKSNFEGALIPVPHLELSPPQYTEKENQLAEQLDCSKNDQGWWVTPLKQLLISEKMMEILLEKLHQETHSGADALVLIAKRHVIGPRMQSLADIIVKKCAICCANNPKIAKKIMGGIVKQGITPGEYWQRDFMELPRCNLYKYLLVMVDTFSGWPEAFPCGTNKAREVIKILLKEIIPRFGVPEGISSDNGPHFIAEIVQGVSRFLDIKWDLHTPWRQQSSGKVERMNQTLKRQISKVWQETQVKWVDILPIALMRV
ncbi:hypothetical protein QYF61_014474 [Mycteria americana]|uniref:Uncharacterized protein n=1 Tax=Mycteria americana TaxID=33587 RepID=A0AAN7MQE1_MYCAM|nr:hypothetical protein QYF61_014474 [Mycteria americana]